MAMGGGPAQALLAGFGSTTSSLELGVWNNISSLLGLNQSASMVAATASSSPASWGAASSSPASWGAGVAAGISGSIGAAAAGGGGLLSASGGGPVQPDTNLSGQLGVSGAVSLQAAALIKEKNWPALLILVIIALTVGGNILVILAVSLEKKLQNATNFFLRSLAVADMLVGILVMPISLINILYDYAWPLPSALCPIWIYLDVLFSTASIMHLCAISLDRYVAIRNPIEHSRFNSRTKAMMKIAAVWTISIGVSMPIPVIGLHNKDKVFVNGSCVLNEIHFMLIGSFVAFFIPLVIMVVSYCLTIQVLQRQATVFLYESRKTSSSQQPLHPAVTPSGLLHPPSSSSTFHLPQINTITPEEETKETHAPPNPGRRNTVGCLKGAEHQAMLLSVSPTNSISVLPEASSQLSSPAAGAAKGEHASCHGRRGMMQAIKNERRASKVLGIVFFLFLVMWCPFFITNVTFVLCRGACDSGLLGELLNVFVWVGYISSGVNPLVYTLFNKTYRRAFSNYIRCRYSASSSANAANVATLSRTLMMSGAPPPHPSHSATTPLLAGRKRGGGDGEGLGGGVVLDRNSNCQLSTVSNGGNNKGAGNNGNAGLPLHATALEPEGEGEELVVVTDNGTRGVVAGGEGAGLVPRGSNASSIWRRGSESSQRSVGGGGTTLGAMSEETDNDDTTTDQTDTEVELSVVSRHSSASQERTSSV